MATHVPAPPRDGELASRRRFNRLGSGVGAHASRVGIWFTSAPWTIALAMVTWLVLCARQMPCRQTDLTNAPNTFYRLCYSDIPVLYQSRHLAQGANPFAMEYPVLTGGLVHVARGIAAILGAPQGASVGARGELDGANIFFAVNAVLLFACFLVTVIAAATTNRHRPFDALMVAGAPVVAATGLINWDMLVVALTALACWAWARRMPVVAGVFIGLGVAAKLYPFMLLIALFPLCLRARRLNEFVQATGAAVIAWCIPNGLLAFVDRDAWLYFWTFNVDRNGDLGSIWYVLSLAGYKLQGVSMLTAILDVLGALFVVTIGLLAPRRPRFGQLAFLMVCWFLMVNKVYSPQYVLWLLPLLVLARPVWRDWAIWTIGELVYFAGIWGHLAGTTVVPGTTQDKIYWATVFIRLVVQAYVCAMVIRDILDPSKDPVRAGGLDDPAGGVLDGAADAGWLATLRDGILGKPDEADGSDDDGQDPAPVVVDPEAPAAARPLVDVRDAR